MLINQLARGQVAECSYAGHSALRAQPTVLGISSPIAIICLFFDPWRDNLCTCLVEHVH